MMYLNDLDTERYEVRDDSEQEYWDMATDTSSNLALYHFWVDDEKLYCRAALVGFDYSSDDDHLIITDDFKVVIQGSKELETNPASLYWRSDGGLIELNIISISYYESRQEFLADNPVRMVDRVDKKEYFQSDEEY